MQGVLKGLLIHSTGIIHCCAFFAGIGGPTCLYSTLHALLVGQDNKVQLSKVYEDKPAYLRRSCDILHFFTIMAGVPFVCLVPDLTSE